MTRETRSNAFSINPDDQLSIEDQLLLDAIAGRANPPPAPRLDAITPLGMLVAFAKSDTIDKTFKTPPASPSGCNPRSKRNRQDEDDKDKDGQSPIKPVPQPPPFAL